jgi:hypothetical protein
MIRSALLLCAAFLAVVSSACAPPLVLPPPPPPSYIAAATCGIGAQPFLQKVQFLPSGYDPSGRYDLPPFPGANPTPIDPNSKYAAALQNAFVLAPPAFQNRLCSLTAIYVNGPDACATDCFRSGSWGYRAKDGTTYVAITAGLWNLRCPDGSSYVYHCFETDLLNQTISWPPNPPVPLPQYTTANPEADTFDMTILAALAHEVGHVRWYEVLNPDIANWGGRYNPSTFCGRSFFSQPWYGGVHQPPNWRYFAARRQGTGLGDLHRRDPQIDTIDRAKGINSSVLTYLDQLYQPSQPWASFVGAVTPDEDFVETFKLWVLTNAQANQIRGEGPLRYLSISFLNGVPENIPQDYGIPDPMNNGAPSTTNKPLLATKAKCIGQYVI